jgi:hypothetical protein
MKNEGIEYIAYIESIAEDVDCIELVVKDIRYIESLVKDIKWTEVGVKDFEKIDLTLRRGDVTHIVSGLEGIPEGMRKIFLTIQERIKSLVSRAEDVQKINLAIQSGNFSNLHQLTQSIIRRIKALDYKEIKTTLSDASLWEITLPTTGFKLSSQKALFCLTCSENSQIFQELYQPIQKSNYTFLILVAKNNCCEQDLKQLQTIWLDYPTLQTLIETPEEKVVEWLTSTLFRQTNSVTLPGILPYKTKGSAGDSFFGRDSELARIVNGYQKGGILIGAHRSGKTSFLNKLQEKLSRNGSEVIGPESFFSLKGFFQETLTSLDIPWLDSTNCEEWAFLLKEYSRKNSGKRLVFLLDEVDGLITIDAEIDFKLSQQMRRLQNEGYCEFFLAGHNKLREAITTEYSPLRNFAEEMILLGLTKEAAKDLIQQPMKSLGFEVTDAYVNRIYTGTAGVAVLIQEFCVKLLNELNQNGASEITQNDIEKVEQMPEFLAIVRQYYEYAQDRQSLSITILTAINREISRDDIRNKFSEYGISYTKQKLDSVLKFLTAFGVLKEYKSGHFRILAKYLQDAIEANEPQVSLKETLEMRKF